MAEGGAAGAEAAARWQWACSRGSERLAAEQGWGAVEHGSTRGGRDAGPGEQESSSEKVRQVTGELPRKTRAAHAVQRVMGPEQTSWWPGQVAEAHGKLGQAVENPREDREPQ